MNYSTPALSKPILIWDGGVSPAYESKFLPSCPVGMLPRVKSAVGGTYIGMFEVESRPAPGAVNGADPEVGGWVDPGSMYYAPGYKGISPFEILSVCICIWIFYN